MSSADALRLSLPPVGTYVVLEMLWSSTGGYHFARVLGHATQRTAVAIALRAREINRRSHGEHEWEWDEIPGEDDGGGGDNKLMIQLRSDGRVSMSRDAREILCGSCATFLRQVVKWRVWDGNPIHRTLACD